MRQAADLFPREAEHAVRQAEGIAQWFDLIYVSGASILEHLKTPGERRNVWLIEEVFHRLMFEGAE